MEIVYVPIMSSVRRMPNQCVLKMMILRFQHIKGKDGNAAMDILMTITNIRYAHLNQATVETVFKIMEAQQLFQLVDFHSVKYATLDFTLNVMHLSSKSNQAAQPTST